MTAGEMASYGALSPGLPTAGVLSARMYRRNAILMACVAGALVLVLVAIATVSSAGPTALLETEGQARYMAMQRVAAAQARVAHDIAALKQTETETGVTPQQLKDFDYSVFDLNKNGPVAPEEHREFSKGGLPLENPETEFIHTPRIAHKHNYKFAPNVRDCPGGNCEHMDEEGIVTDRWPADIYSMIPQPSWDPSAAPAEGQAINQRTGQYARHLRTDTYHPPVNWGLGGLGGHGNMHSVDRGAEALDKAHVVHDRWPIDVYHAFPNPAWDDSEYDQDKHAYKMPPSTPLDVVAATQRSQEPLEDAGVNVNHLPTDTEHRAYNQVDGLLDRLMPVEKAPQWRKGGIATQERPEHFLLREHVDLTAPQAHEDRELGYEDRTKDPGPDSQAHWGFWESIGCAPQGCFGKRTGQQ